MHQTIRLCNFFLTVQVADGHAGVSNTSLQLANLAQMLMMLGGDNLLTWGFPLMC